MKPNKIKIQQKKKKNKKKKKKKKKKEGPPPDMQPRYKAFCNDEVTDELLAN